MTPNADGQSLRLLDQIRGVLRVHRYAIRTERAYCDWVRRYVKFHRMKSRQDLPASPMLVNTESVVSAQAQPKKLLEQVRDELRLRRYSLRTERAYTDWVKRYVSFHALCSRAELEDGTAKVAAFVVRLQPAT